MTAPRLLFLHGPAAAGKLTIARELAAATGLPLFHNHLAVDLLLNVFPFGHPEFIRLREQLWLDVMTAAVADGRSLLFTFAPERTVSTAFPATLAARIAGAGGRVHFVQVQCDEAEIERRLALPSRATHRKLNSLSTYRTLRAEGAFDYPALPAEFTVDSGRLTPAEAAQRIAQHFTLT